MTAPLIAIAALLAVLAIALTVENRAMRREIEAAERRIRIG